MSMDSSALTDCLPQRPHDGVAHRHNHKCCQDRGRHSVLEKVDRTNVPLPQLVLLIDAGLVSIKRTMRMEDETHAVMFGKPDTGRPMPAEQMRAVAMMSKRGWGSSSDSPIREAMGTSRTAAIVWEIL